MFWSDLGIIISIKPRGERSKTVNIFTKEHGRVIGYCHNNAVKGLDQFALAAVEYTKRSEFPGCWKFKQVCTSFNVYAEHYALLAMQGICNTLCNVLPYNVKFSNLFNFLVHNFGEQNINYETWRKYAKFEIFLLNVLGFGVDLETCCLCCNNKPDFISETGATICTECSNSNIKEYSTFYIPNAWYDDKWNDRDIMQSLHITGILLNRHIKEHDNFFRQMFIDSIKQRNAIVSL